LAWLLSLSAAALGAPRLRHNGRPQRQSERTRSPGGVLRPGHRGELLAPDRERRLPAHPRRPPLPADARRVLHRPPVRDWDHDRQRLPYRLLGHAGHTRVHELRAPGPLPHRHGRRRGQPGRRPQTGPGAQRTEV